MPGEDAREAARTVTGTLEALRRSCRSCPARGPGADMTGRTVGLLAELYAHVEPSGWRLSDRPGRDTRRARSWLGEDLDALEEFTQGTAVHRRAEGLGRRPLDAGGRPWSGATARPCWATRVPAAIWRRP